MAEISINRKTIALISLAVLSVVIFFSILFYKLYHDPNVIFLAPEDNAEWIKYDRPIELEARYYKKMVTLFKTPVTADKHFENITLTIHALRFFKVFFDDNLVFESSTVPKEWKRKQLIDINDVSPGTHELTIAVMNYDGPPSVLAYNDKLKINSDSLWQSSQGDNNWKNSALAKIPAISPHTRRFDTSYESFFKTIPWAIAILTLCVCGFMVHKLKPHIIIQAKNIPPFNNIIIFRWLLLLSWTLLAISSLINHPISGMDFDAHLEYINYIRNNWSLPLAPDGWQMFQSPLYYIICAVLLGMFDTFLDPQTSTQLIKIVPLICGILIVEICYRSLKYTFPNDEKSQFFGLIVGGLIPMNLYMSQYVGNETTAALFSSLVILYIIKFTTNPAAARLPKQQVILGLWIGLGLLSKISFALLLFPVFLVYIWILHTNNTAHRQIVFTFLRISLVVFCVSGWYYIRNWIYLGQPFVAGWNAENGIQWWQDPGYRVIQNFTNFGLSLIYPVYSSTVGFWDSLYSAFWVDSNLGGSISTGSKIPLQPPWNYPYMLSLPLLSMVPSVLILAGIFSATKRNQQTLNTIYVFSVSSVLIYFVAITLYYISVPAYTTAKATYTLGLIPCYAILCAKGLGTLARGKFSLAFFTTLIVLWGIYSYISFFPNPWHMENVLESITT